MQVAVAARLPLRSQDPGFREGLRRHGVRPPDHFVGGDGADPYWTLERLLDTLAVLPLGVTELMCHPGHFDEALAYSRYGRQRQVELAALLEPEARATAQRLGIQLCHFGTLPAERSRAVLRPPARQRPRPRGLLWSSSVASPRSTGRATASGRCSGRSMPPSTRASSWWSSGAADPASRRSSI